MGFQKGEMIRKIKPSDNSQIAAIIRSVMPEFGASGKGFAIHDKEVDNMYATYTQPRSCYFVYEENTKILGGGGIAPLLGGDSNTCELKKMYFLAEARGKGLGQQVLGACLDAARATKFEICYLETFNTMTSAMQLYERNGFAKIPGPLGNTGHFSCDRFYTLKL